MAEETQHAHTVTPPDEVTLDVNQADPTVGDVLHEEVPQTAPSDDTTHAAIQSAAEAQQPQPVWNPATGQYYYPSVAGQPGSETYMSADYNINGVMSLPTDHYVTAAGDDFSGVAATLSNWAEANPTDDPNAGLPLVAPPVNGDLDVHVPVNGDMGAPAPSVLTEKPKKLVLACHFCRGRKLKCDGARPTCSHCAKRSQPCTYDEQVRRRGPGKRTKEMRERAAREAEAAGLGLTADSLAHLASEAEASVLAEVAPKKPGRKRKSEALDEMEKKARLDLDEEQQAAAHAAVAAAAAGLPSHDAHEIHHDVHHSLEALGAHDGMIDPALTGEGLDDHSGLEQSMGLDQSVGLDQHGVLDQNVGLDQGLDQNAHLDENGLDQDGTVLDLPPLGSETLGQVIQQLGGQ